MPAFHSIPFAFRSIMSPTPDTSSILDTLHQIALDSTMVVWMTDAGGNCIYLNNDELIPPGDWHKVNIQTWAKFIHPDDLARISPVVRLANETCTEYQVEYRIVRPDGATRWMMSSASPRFAVSKEFSGYVGSIVDVSDRYEAYERLAASELELRLVAENTSDLITHCDSDGVVVYISPSSTPILGYDAAELTGTSIYDILHPEDMEIARQEVQRQSRDEGSVATIVLRKRHKAGHFVWLGTRVRVVLDPLTGKRIGSVAVCRDITTEHQKAIELSIREEQFRSLTAMSSDWYWETDEQDRFTFLSDGIAKLSSMPPSHFLGKRRSDFASSDAEPWLQKYLAHIGQRTPFKRIPFKTTERLTGTPRHLKLSGEPVFDGRGKFKGYRGVGRDVSEEVEIAEKLAALAGANTALIENSLDIMVMLGRDGRYLHANQAVHDILGYEPQEMIGRHYTDFLMPEDHESGRDIETNLRNGKDTIEDSENRWIRKDGTIVYLATSIRWSSDSDVMYATARDVTERINIRTALNASRDELVAVLESIGDGFYTLDQNWCLTYVNQKTADFIAIPRQQLLGRNLLEVVPSFKESSLYPHFQRSLESHISMSFEEFFEPVKAWVEVRLYPHKDGLAVFFHDVSERHRSEEIIRRGKQQLQSVIDMTPAGYLLTNADGIILDVNQSFCDISGYQREELTGHDVSGCMPGCPLVEVLAVRDGIAAAHGRETTVQRKDGQEAFVLANVSIARDFDGEAVSLTAFVTDITERKRDEIRLQQLATLDSLTGLPNRALINTRLQQMLDAGRPEDVVAVLFIDLDRFKQINDSLGHGSGDSLLQLVAGRLQTAMRQHDIIARMGGDEFIAAASCPKGRESATAIAEKLLSALRAPFNIDGQHVVVTASIGLSLYPSDGATKERLFQNADIAMYRAKETGRDRYCFFEPAMSAEANARMKIEQALHWALERGEFELHYQPRIDLRTMAVTGMEALIRWNHPQLGRIPPLSFIPIAEERGYIEEIGRWVLDEACLQTQRLIEKYGRPLHVSVNVSAKQLRSVHLGSQVAASLARASLPPQLLEIELTESALIENVDLSVQMLNSLKETGVRISVDDFGTGYSGLSYLRKFPLDILKLDRSFLTQDTEGVSNFSFVKAFVDLAHALNLSVVAEGVEDEPTLCLLKNSACDEAQGYLFAKPMALAEFEQYLSRLTH